MIEPMSRIENYRLWYEHEKDANKEMIAMIDSVPPESREDERFHRALALAAHLAACRENWLDHMTAGGVNQTAWWPESAKYEELGPRYATIEKQWTDYFASLD